MSSEKFPGPGPVKVAIVSDTHSEIAPEILQVVRGCDLALHAGDILGAGVLEAMAPKSGKVLAVRGNNDFPSTWAAAEQGVIARIPNSLELSLPGGVLAMEHGHVHGGHQPDHASLRRAHPGARVIVYGHTHKQVVDDSEEPMVINPGAAGYTRNHGGPSCLVLYAGSGQWRVERFRFPGTQHAWA